MRVLTTSAVGGGGVTKQNAATCGGEPAYANELADVHSAVLG